MIRTTRRRRLPLTALSLVLVAGTALAGAVPAQALSTSAGAQPSAAASAATPAPDALPTPTVTYESFLGTESSIGVSVDAAYGDAVVDPEFEYQLDGSGPWIEMPYRSEYYIPASPGDHLLSFRLAGSIDGVRRYSPPTTPRTVYALGLPKAYTPTAVVNGPDVTFSWDVRDALNGWKDDNIYYAVGLSGDDVAVGAVGSVTLHVGYDSSVYFRFWFGGGGDFSRFSDQTVQTGSAPGAVPLRSTGTPVILGTPEYNAVLSVRTGNWQPAPVDFAYQWYADGEPIYSAIGPTFRVTSNEVGHRITVDVRGSRSGYVSATRTSAATRVIAEPVITAGTPRITGNPVVGRTLTAQPGVWKPASLTLGYQWTRDGAEIPAATAKTYTLTTADRGHTVAVVVRGTIDVYESKSRTSAGVKVR